MKKVFGILIFLAGTCTLWGASEARTLLVFPFENRSSRPDLNWISEGFAVVLSNRLSGASRYLLTREERNAAYEQLGIPAETPLTLASKYKVAETLGADWAVIGSFSVEGTQLTARAQLLDHKKLSSVLEVTGELPELVDLETRLAWRLLETQDPTSVAGSEEDFRRTFPAVRLDAFENYVRGILAIDPDAKQQFLRESDRLNPADHSAAFELGRFYFGEKDYEDSEKWLAKVDEKDPSYFDALFLKGVSAYFLGHDAAAEKAFQTLSTQVPLQEITNNLGVMKTRRGRYAEAADAFQQACQGDPADPDFCFNLGVALYYLRRYDEASRHLQHVLELNDDDSEAHALLVLVSGKLRNTAAERQQLQWLSRHESGMATLPAEFKPEVRLKKHYDGRAFHLLSLALQNVRNEKLAKLPESEQASVHLSEGKRLFGQGQLAEAESELKEAVALAPWDSDAHLALGEVYEAQKQHADAASELETSLRLKDNLSAHLWLASVYLWLGNTEAAREHGQAALALDPGNEQAARLMDRIREQNTVPRTSP